MDIHVIGPRDRGRYPGVRVVNTTSQSPDEWSKAFSPFFLGPVPLYNGLQARCMENAWQFAKCYTEDLDESGAPSSQYWAWAKAGWARSSAVRYPKFKGAKPAYLLWNGERLGYIEARKRVYFPLYRDAVKQTRAFAELQKLAATTEIALWDFDGYDHEGAQMSLKDVLNNERRPMGHAFVLKAMLIHGANVSPDEIEDTCRKHPSSQMSFL